MLDVPPLTHFHSGHKSHHPMLARYSTLLWYGLYNPNHVSNSRLTAKHEFLKSDQLKGMLALLSLTIA